MTGDQQDQYNQYYGQNMGGMGGGAGFSKFIFIKTPSVDLAVVLTRNNFGRV
jgi:hypothetical protein